MLKTTAVAVLLSTVLVGCGDNSSSDKDTPGGGSTKLEGGLPEVQPTPDAAGAEEVVRAWSEAFAERDSETICNLGTDAFHKASVESWNEEGWGAKVEDCEGLAKEAFKLYESFGLTPADLKVQDVKIEVDGEEAAYATLFTGKTAAEADPERYRLVWVDGEWLVDGEGEIRMPDDAPKLEDND